MRGNIAEIHDGGDILLLGRFGALSKLPPEMRQPRRASLMLRSMMLHPDAVRQVRLAWAEWSAHPTSAFMSDHEIYLMMDQDLQHGKIQGVPIPHARMSHTSGKTAALQQAVRPTGGRRGTGASTASSAGTTSSTTTATNTSRSTAPRPVGQWSTEERISAVIRRTIPKVPGHVRQAMMGLLSPESIATMALTMGIVAAANLTPYGWAADAVLAGLAFGFGGIAALEALGDLAECFRKTAGAQTEVDIELAASALARAVVALGALGLMAILHKISSRKGTGSPGDGEADAIAPRKGAGGGKTGEPPSSRNVAPPKDEPAPSKPPPKPADSPTPPKPPADDPPAAAKPPAEPEKPSSADAKPAADKALPEGMKWTDNQSIREWYNKQTDPERLAKLDEQWQKEGLSAEQRAEKAFDIRHDARLTARKYMENREEVAALQQRDLAKYGNPDGPTFASEVAKYQQQGLKGADVYQAIIKGASRTDGATNAKFGIKR